MKNTVQAPALFAGKKNLHSICLILAFVGCIFTQTVNAGLLGTNLSVKVLVQPTSSGSSDATTFDITAKVAEPSIEFPSLGSLTLNPPQPGLRVVDVSINAGDDFIEIGFDNTGASSLFSSAYFNGYEFTFDSNVAAIIKNASIDTLLTTLGLTASDVTFSGNKLLVNVEGLSFTTSTFVRINLKVDGGSNNPLSPPPKNYGMTNTDCPKTCDGNPIDSSTGNKFQTETDFVGAENTGLEMHRFYNSQNSSETAFGTGWRGTWQQSISGLASSGKVQAIRPDGRVETFTKSTANTWQWLADPDVTNQLILQNDVSGQQPVWRLITSDDKEEKYDLDGRLIRVDDNRLGLATFLAYDSNNRLSTVTKVFGRTLTFAYDGNNRVSSITLPDGGVISYGYDASNNLVSVTHPDKTVRQYLYENTTFVHALTGITDENGKRFATWTYDAQGRATSSQHAGGAELTKVDYNADGTATVTDARGNQHSYNFTTQFDMVKPTSVTGTAFKNLGGKAFTYDTSGFVASKTDFNGNVTTYVRDARGLETSRTEASGSPLARTITTSWDSYYHLPTQITEPNRVTRFSYDSSGRMLQRTVTAGAISRTWNYTYQGWLVLTVDGPRTDVKDITKFSYDNKDNLAAITNPLGHITKFTAYDINGRPLSFTDANGLVTSLTYDARGQLTSTKAGTELTTYTRDAVGQITKITAPDGSYIALSYDDAHRLVKVTDQLGNHIDYTLDAESNRVKQDIYDPKANLTQTLINKFDSNNRLATTFGADGQKTLYGYDDNDNLVGITDPLGNKTQLSYDALNRLISSIDAAGAVTKTAYDVNDNLQSVTDPLNHQTQYGYDGLGNPLSVKSPDTGLSKITYDSAGNRMSAVDAKNQSVKYSYDALNRLTKMVYGINTTVSFAYDQSVNGKGHLTQMTEVAGTTSWTYDSHGRISSKTFAIGTVKLITRYSYDANGLLTAITYPSGKVLQLAYSNGLVSGLSSGGKSLVSAIHYQPFGSAADWVFGNGVKTIRDFDLDGRITAYDLGERSRQLSYDAASRITGYKDTDMNYDQNYTYDAVNRLLGVSTPSTKTDYSYDANGNRTQLIAGGKTNTSTLDAASNRLLKISQAATVVKNYSYDAAGNIVGDGANNFTYDGRGRLIKAVGSFGTESYSVNGLGQRVAKTLGVTSTYFVYDEAGHLLGEYDKLGKAIQETVWLGDMPVAMSAANVNYFVYADHLNAPRAIANSTGKVIWRWDGDAFGATLANEDPDKNGVKFTYNLRFPGQYFDKSTGLHYNGFRDYDPTTGRYMQSDQIGLMGGVNTYGYVSGNPVNYTDSSGLIIDILADIGFIAYDLYKLASEGACERNANLTAFGLDVVGAIIPGVTGLGEASRVAHGVEHVANATANSALKNIDEGIVYIVPGTHTISGLPYVGTSNQFDAVRKFYSGDGRNRLVAEKWSTYQIGDIVARKAAEQRAMIMLGGLSQLDNRRNEIAFDNLIKYGLDFH